MKNVNVFNASFVYILLWMLYNLQGFLYPSGNIISRCLLLILLLWSIGHFILCHQFRNNPPFFTGLDLLLAMFTVYGFLLIVSGNELYITENELTKVRNFEYLKSIYISLLPVYSFYYYTKMKQLNQRKLIRLLILFALVAIVQYSMSFLNSFAIMSEKRVDVDGITNNAGYIILSLVPFAVCLSGRKLSEYLFLLCSMALILLSMKRGAILIVAIVLIFYLYKKFKSASTREKWSISLLTIIIGLIAYYLFTYLLETSSYFSYRMEAAVKGDTSTRGTLYSNLWQIFSGDSDILQMLFGRGAWGTLSVGMNFAHNDWLEILINQGLFGIGIFALYWLCFLRTATLNRYGEKERLCISMVFIIYLCKTFFSMSYSDFTVYANFILGFSLANGFSRNKIQ